MVSLLSSLLLCVVTLWFLFGALQGAVYRFLQPTLAAIDPSQASAFILAWQALPLLAAVTTGTVLYSPDLAQWFVAGHCHTGQCAMHGPQSSLAVLPAAALVTWTLYRLLHCLLRQWLPARRLRQHLIQIGDRCGDVVTLPASEPVAFTVGWLQPQVFISTGMRAACSAREIECIVYHESAHRQRHDNLRLLTSRLLTAPLPARWSQVALDDLKLCCEHACDLHAASMLSRECVAAALLKVTRIQRQCIPAGSLAFAGNRTQQRILALLDEPRGRLQNHVVVAVISVLVLAMLAMINPLHRAIELIP
ncbi:MAG: M56 family metallopeptidase [Halioglobus sp.]|nr:M56 family metallopeptidase [Halioglobus sp.]